MNIGEKNTGEAYSKLLRYAYNLVSKKRYTKAEMYKKLKQFVDKHARADAAMDAGVVVGDGVSEDMACGNKGRLTEEIVPKVMDRLIELKYLDDTEYCTAYINSRLSGRPKGKFLLKRELKMKGVDEKIIDEAVFAAEINENEVAEELLSRKMRVWTKLPREKQKSRAYNFLLSRGFARESIYKAVQSCYNSSVNEDLS